jgi:hypothetical protein
VGEVRMPKPVKLVASLLGGDPVRIEDARVRLETRYGPVDFASGALPFDQTDYYAEEFGVGLVRRIVAFGRLIAPDELPGIKIATNDLEAELAVGARRTVNIDPGYVTEAKLVLATTKDHPHRLYLGRGIYGEVTLQYVGGGFRSWPWTYPDYASPGYREVFEAIRARFRAQLRAAMAAG